MASISSTSSEPVAVRPRLTRVAAAVDGTQGGRDAAALGALLAEISGAGVELIAVHPDPIVVAPPGLRFADLREDAQRMLWKTRDEVAPAATTTVEAGWSVPHTLTRVIVRDRLDLLVVGSSPNAAAGEVRIGQRTRQLIGEAAIPLAVAPWEWGATAPTPMTRIAVGYDAGDESAAALALAGALSQACGAQLTVMAVADNRLPGRRAVAPNVDPVQILWDKAVGPTRNALEESARAAVEHAWPGADVRAELGAPPDLLRGLSSQVDLIVIGSRRWGLLARVLLGSVGEALMRGARCPVIVVPRPPTE